jgi:hypothetical protein
MTEIKIDINGLDRAIDKLKKIPGALDRAMIHVMSLSLLELWAAVRPYPSKPARSKYVRTGTLGRSLGSSQAGGRSGAQPTVYSIQGQGAKMKGRFGTDLSYAKYVIDPKRQAYMHKGRWWTMEHVKKGALPKIKKHWYDLVKRVLHGKP